MTEKDELELKTLKLAESVRERVEQELKRRYSWLGFALAIIVGSLITLTVDSILKGTQISLAKAQAIQDVATTNLAAVALRSEQVAKEFEQYQEKIAGLNKIAASITEQLKQANDNNTKYSSELRNEVSGLAAVVKKLAAKPSQENISGINADIENIDKTLGKYQVDMDKASKVFENKMKQVQKQIQAQRPMFKKWDW